MGSYQGDDTTGFQSPAQDYIEPVINMADILDLHRPGIYPVRVVGQELRSRGGSVAKILREDDKGCRIACKIEPVGG